MKKIEAIFVPEKFDQVREAMNKLNLRHFLVTKLMAHQPDSATERRWGDEWHEDLVARLKLEILVQDQIAEATARAILRATRTRNPEEAVVTTSTVEVVKASSSGPAKAR